MCHFHPFSSSLCNKPEGHQRVAAQDAPVVVGWRPKSSQRPHFPNGISKLAGWFHGKSYKKRKMITGVPPWIGNLHQPRNIASFFETYQVSGNSGPIHHIKPYFWEYSLKFSPYIGLAYGRDLQFRLLEWPLHRGEYLVVSIHNSLLNGSLTKLITYWLVVS